VEPEKSRNRNESFNLIKLIASKRQKQIKKVIQKDKMKIKKIAIFLSILVLLVGFASFKGTITADESYGLIMTEKGEMYRDLQDAIANFSSTSDPGYFGGFNEAAFVPVLKIPEGDGDFNVSILKEVQGSNPMGPESFAIDRDKIYILDSVGKKILIYRCGEPEKIINIGFSTYPIDIAILGNSIFLQDGNGYIYVLNDNGKLIRAFKLPVGIGSLDVQSLKVESDGVKLWLNNNFEFRLDELPFAFSVADIKGKENKRGFTGFGGKKFISEYLGVKDAQISSTDNKIRISIKPVKGTLGSVRIIAFDNKNNIYALVEELANTYPGVQVDLTLQCYSSLGKMIGIAGLPLAEMVSIPNKIVEVTKDGEIFIMVPKAQETIIYKVVLGERHFPEINNTKNFGNNKSVKESINTTTVVYGGFKGYPISQTRSSTRERALQMINYSWTWNNKYDYFPNGTYRPSDLGKPNQLKNLGNGALVTGIPYTMGGWDSPWTWSDGQPWRSFASSLSYYSTYGPLVGNTGNNRYSGTSGLDCAGFVAAASDTYKIGTINGTTYCKPNCYYLYRDGKSATDAIGGTSGTASWNAWSGIQPMDFFVKPDLHVLMYNLRLLDGSGISTLECTTSIGYSDYSSPSQGAKLSQRRWSDLNGYYHKSRWDRQTGDDFNLSFTSPNTLSAIQGQQIYYAWNATTTGNKTVSVYANSGDPDLYIYDQNYNFIAKSDNLGSDSITFYATAGQKYYFKIHIYSYSGANYTIIY